MTGNQEGSRDVPLGEMISHPDRELQAQADESLASEEAATLTAHLGGCARCARRVEELRAVRRLLAAAPPPRPSRPLVPRLARLPAWLRPARSLASVGAGTFLFLFLASAVLHTGSDLGGGTTAAERAAARGQLAAPAQSQAHADAPRVDTATGTASRAAGPAASEPPQAALQGGPESASRTATAREFGPPPWTFALLAALCAALALAFHRRLHRR